MLIATVGGSPEPIIISCKHWNPARVIFLASQQTSSDIKETIIPAAQRAGLSITAGNVDIITIYDAQDLSACVERMRALDAIVAAWLRNGPGHMVVVDITGGTKCMTAALALIAQKWDCTFSYIGGAERSKDGKGTVISGHERILSKANPWDMLGYNAINECILLFDRYQFAAARLKVEDARQRAERPDVKSQLSAFACLATAYQEWDRFKHREALNALKDVLKNASVLRDVLGRDRGDLLRQELECAREFLKRLVAPERSQEKELLLDLIANAIRRGEEERYDDAVARLYRVVEAAAQYALRKHQINDTGAVELQSLPAELKEIWQARAVDGDVMLGLQDDYRVLQLLGDNLGGRFIDLGLGNRDTSPLSGRNRSILAHGFESLSKSSYERMLNCALALTGFDLNVLPRFPKIMGAG